MVLFLCAGILSPKEMLEGFSNKGMITVAMLFLVSEGVRQSGALGQVIKKLLPEGKTTVFKAQLRMLPSIAFISAFLNNTPVVVIFAPIIKRWAQAVHLPATKFLIPLSYVTILGGICTLIGTSTNLVVHGMILEAGYEGFTMFELGKVGIFIAIAGIIYLFVFSKKLLPDARPDTAVPDEEVEKGENLHRVEAVLGARFPGINKTLAEFNFQRHYGAEVKEIKTRNGQRIIDNLNEVVLREGDTLVVMADETFVPTWGESSVFVLLANGKDTEPVPGKKKRWFALILLILMILGATVGELPVTQEMFPNIKLDMFFFVSVTTIIMAWTKIFPARKYTKYISWDIMITIACDFAEFGCSRWRSCLYYQFEQRLWSSRFVGYPVYHNQSVYRAYYKQCGSGFGIPAGTGYFPTVGSRSDTILCGYLYGGFCQLFNSYRLSDKSDRARYRQL